MNESGEILVKTFIGTHGITFLFGLTAGISIYAILKSFTELANKSPTGAASTMSDKSDASRSFMTASELELEPVKKMLDEQFTISKEILLRVTRQMVIEMKRGLQADGQTLLMIPSFVSNLPTGKEEGSYLALDLGGSNFRVCEILLSNDSVNVRSRQKKFVVSEELKAGNADDLFDFFAQCIRTFLMEILEISEDSIKTQERKLGFTFSFPVKQTGLAEGSLMVWTKGFVTKGVVGNDVVSLLQAALLRKKINIKVNALVNDTVGTLVAHSYVDPGTYAGVILGTGTNAAYVEDLKNIPKWKGGPTKSGKMLINTEWGAFDEEHTVIPFTKYDKKLDKSSSNHGKQIFEKMISGLYLGEVVRYVLLDLIKNGYLFKSLPTDPPILSTPYKFETAFMSRIERDHSNDLSDISTVIRDLLQVQNSTINDRILLKRVCELVGLRAARLSAAGIAALVTKMNKLDGCTIAIDGSVFEHYPHFGNRMRDALFELLGISAENIEFAQARDGSGTGAALIAALAEE